MTRSYHKSRSVSQLALLDEWPFEKCSTGTEGHSNSILRICDLRRSTVATKASHMTSKLTSFQPSFLRPSSVALSLAALLTLGVAACGSDDDDSNSAGSGGATGGSAGSAGNATGGSAGNATGGSAGNATGGSAGNATGGSAGNATGGSAGNATGGSAGATGGSGGGGGGNPGFVIGLDGIDAFDNLSSADKDALRAAKVFFEHMSVGDNLMLGYNNWDSGVAGASLLGFDFDTVYDGSDYDSGTTLGEKAFGYNGDPMDKIDGYSESMLSLNIGAKVDVAGFKFCYNDIDTSTTSNADDVIAAYGTMYTQVESQTSNVAFFHITTPLQPENSYQAVENNTLRVKFGDFLKSTYAGGRHVVFDLQEVESTRSDGSQCSQGGVPVLCSEWAGDDDGHLSHDGSTRAAKAFLYTLHVARGL